MKKYWLLILLLIDIQVIGQQVFDSEVLKKIAFSDEKKCAGQFRPSHINAGPGYDVKWYGCHWQIDPDQQYISGNVTMLFRAGNTPMDSLILDLHRDLSVLKVTFHGAIVSSKHSADQLTIFFPSAISSGTLDSLTVFYQGVPGDLEVFSRSTHQGTPIIWTLSEPYGSYTWWPCKDGLTDKADSIDVYISAKNPYKAVSNGIPEEVTPGTGYTLYHWKHRYPVAPYLVCLAVTNYVQYSENIQSGGNSLPFVNYVYPEDSATARSQTGAVIPMIHLYDSLFGAYPYKFEKYGQAEFGWGGGMEHQTITFLGGFGYELMAHELAHQWFGDKITCGSWHDIWLNEGFATYLSGLVYEFLQPMYWKRFREVRVKNIVSKPGGSVYCDDTTQVSRIFDARLSYAKGALILHQLRWIYGDSIFFMAMKNYISDPGFAFGFATTANFRQKFEEACQCDLSWYFNDWFTGQGYPSYTLNWSQTGPEVMMQLSQVQSHPSVSFFELPVPIRLKNSTRDTLIIFENAYSGQISYATIPFTADSAIIDPDYQLITGNNMVNGMDEKIPSCFIRIQPNPADDFITFESCNLSGNQDSDFSVFDATGRKLLMNKSVAPDKTLVFDTENLPSGLYFYLYRSGHERISGKFVINH